MRLHRAPRGGADGETTLKFTYTRAKYDQERPGAKHDEAQTKQATIHPPPGPQNRSSDETRCPRAHSCRARRPIGELSAWAQWGASAAAGTVGIRVGAAPGRGIAAALVARMAVHKASSTWPVAGGARRRWSCEQCRSYWHVARLTVLLAAQLEPLDSLRQRGGRERVDCRVHASACRTLSCPLLCVLH